MEYLLTGQILLKDYFASKSQNSAMKTLDA